MWRGLQVLGVAAVVALAHGTAPAAAASHALYFPGVQPEDYEAGAQVTLWANKVLSSKTQLPYRYHALPVCQPTHRAVEKGGSLGEVLAGDRLERTDYDIRMYKNDFCRVLCRTEWDSTALETMREVVGNAYNAQWVLDNLPAAVQMVNTQDPDDIILQRGFPLGFVDEGGKRILFNHLRFIVRYHKTNPAQEGSSARVVGFEVVPMSVSHKYEGTWGANTALTSCPPGEEIERTDAWMSLDGDGVGASPKSLEVIFTYDVQWEESDVEWEHRWDAFLDQSRDVEIHWLAIGNSLAVVLLLTALIGIIVLRSLYMDLEAYNTLREDGPEETGWKLVHRQVFRPPEGFFGPMFLSVFVGSGAQVGVTAAATLALAAAGLLSPAARGALLTALIFMFAFSAFFAGLVSSSLYKMVEGKAWKRNTFLTAAALPGAVILVLSIVNSVAWAEESSAAIPAFYFFVLFLIWFFLLTPIVFVGSYLGFTRTITDEKGNPVTPGKPSAGKKDLFPRVIPPQPWYLHPVLTCLLGGLLPFGSVFIETYFIMSSIWLHQIYYVFGFLVIVFLVTIITCAEISIVLAYFQLSAEDYNWWWRSFLTAGSSALYLLLYSVFYYLTKLELTWTASVVYFSYMGLVSWFFFLLTGSIGFLATLQFVRTIYGALKVD